MKGCREKDKAGQMISALTVMFKDVEGISVDDTAIIEVVTQVHEANVTRLQGREQQKVDVRKKMRARQSDHAWDQLDVTATKGKLVNGSGVRRVLSSLLFEGVDGKTRERHVRDAANQGFEYMAGGAADVLQRTSAMTSLKLAITRSKSSKPEIYQQAEQHATDFLSNCPADLLNPCLQTMCKTLMGMLSIDSTSVPAPLISGLETAIEKDVFRLTFQTFDNDCHVRVWRRLSRLVERAKANQRLAKERATAKVKENLSTGSEGTSYHVKENSAQRSA